MKRQLSSALLVVSIGAAFWACSIADSLGRESSGNAPYIDAGAPFTLGSI
jgi:hypothetical protein